MTSKFVKDFISARRVSVPLIGIESSDPAETMRTIVKLAKDEVIKEQDGTENKIDPPITSWDSAAGFKARNEKASEMLKEILGDTPPGSVTDPKKALNIAARFKPFTIMFMLNGHRFIGNSGAPEAAVGQAIWNLRESNKKDGRTLIILGPSIVLPEELTHDVLVLEEALPTKDELESIVKRLCKNIKENDKEVELPDVRTMDKTTEILRGLTAFDAEQNTAMSVFPKNGKAIINLDELWDRKRKAVENTQGLSIYRGKETYNDLVGVNQFKLFLTKLFTGEDPPTELVFMDEIEKMLAGIAGDLSGTSQGQLGEFLRWSQDNEVLAMMLLGHAGCSKSFGAKCTAGEFGVPMIELNFSTLKGGVVGQTENQTKAAFKMCSAIGRPLIIATSNSLAILPPELKRRFKLGTWFSDLPGDKEKMACLDLYLKKFNIEDRKNQGIPKFEAWTPAEIKTCVEMSWRLNCNLIEAAAFVVPISKSDPQKIDELRKTANNRFNDVNRPGPYQYNRIPVIEENEEAIRKITSLRTSEVGEA